MGIDLTEETPSGELPAGVKPLAQHATREEEARRALEHTRVRRSVAAALTLFFLLTILTPPAIQIWAWESGHPAPRRGAAMHARPLRFRYLPQELDILGLLPTRSEVARVSSFQDALDLAPTVDEINVYEDNLKKQSLFGEWVLPPTQWVLTKTLQAGNEQAFTGAPGWLFYRPDVDYLMQPGFLDSRRLQAQRAADKTGHAQSDPLPAILDFQRQLKARGIELLLMPIPAKPTIHPEMLSRRSGSGDLPNNPSYRALIQALRRHDIAVFDPTEFLLQRKLSSGRAQYWPADTHWTPDAMESVARLLARRVQTEYSFAAPPNAGYHREARTVTNLSDIAIMLKLPKWQQLYPRHTVQIHPVYDRYGQLWKSRRQSEILFLGDSFSNIYSRGGYWGESAGLVEQLSYHLQRPIAHIGVDGGGAVVTRLQLASLMRAALHHPGERGPLDGKKLVIYEFAARSLQDSDWRLVELPE